MPALARAAKLCVRADTSLYPQTKAACSDDNVFMGQAPPNDWVRVLLDGVGPGDGTGQPGVSPLALGHAAELWAKADAYYFRTMARLQRLWQVRRCVGLFPARNAARTRLTHTICQCTCAGGPLIGFRTRQWVGEPLTVLGHEASVCIDMLQAVHMFSCHCHPAQDERKLPYQRPKLGMSA